MNFRIAYQLLFVVSIAAGVGCTPTPRTGGESNLAESAEKLGLTQLAHAPAVRRVSTGAAAGLDARPSADGRVFSATDWSTGNLEVPSGKETVTPAQKDETEIRTLSLADGRVTSTGFKQAGLQVMKLSPDGRTLLMSIDNYATEMWAMDPPRFGSDVATAGARK